MFVSGVETTMEWRQFVALGKATGDAWRTETRRLREALKNRKGSSTLKFVPNKAEFDVEWESDAEGESAVEGKSAA